MLDSLVHPLFDGPLDIVGDVHGEIDALTELMSHIGYAEDGTHPDDRRLVFVGDLTDRGPDSPAVVELVQELLNAERAQCVLGNHDLNIMLGDIKHDNHWFYGEDWSLDGSEEPTPAVLADDAVREKVLHLLDSLPLALERDGLRVVHACWDDEMVDVARQATDVIGLYEQYLSNINATHEDSVLDEIDRGLEHQNLNPVKVLTSGKERRVEVPFWTSGKQRYEERVKWWNEYEANALCVFGHYSHYIGDSNSSGRAICIDYAVSKRWKERKAKDFDGNFKGKLAALRIPDMVLVFDEGEKEMLVG